MLEEMTYETYAEQDLEGAPRFHNTFMALPGKSPYDKHYIEECRKRSEAFFKEKEERKKLDEEAATTKAAAEALEVAVPSGFSVCATGQPAAAAAFATSSAATIGAALGNGATSANGGADG